MIYPNGYNSQMSSPPPMSVAVDVLSQRVKDLQGALDALNANLENVSQRLFNSCEPASPLMQNSSLPSGDCVAHGIESALRAVWRAQETVSSILNKL